MVIVRYYNRKITFVSRRFSHKGGEKGGGSGAGSGDGDFHGEFEMHQKMKVIAYAQLENGLIESLGGSNEIDGDFETVIGHLGQRATVEK